MENTSKRLPSRNYVNLIPQGLFLLSILLSVVTTYYVTGHYIDSDASSELVLAKHLAETGQILSQDWYYSTELRVLNTQLVYAPLFLIFEDWHMVRFVGALILQAIMICAYAFLLHEAGVSRRVFYLSASLLLLPVSVAYGRIVLYHCFYIPHIALSFFLVGLTLGFAQKISWRSWKPWLRLFLLLLFSFIGGLGGIRQLMITHAPLALSLVVLFLSQNQQKNGSVYPFSFEQYQAILCALISSLSSVLGFKGNGILSDSYSFFSQSETRLGFIEFTEFNDILYGFFHQFGFRDNVKMLTLTGILSLAGIFAGIYSIIVSVKEISAGRAVNDKAFVIQSFFFYYTATMLAVFIVTGKYQSYYFYLYLLFCLSWVSPLLFIHLSKLFSQKSSITMQKLLILLTIVILFINGFANLTYFNGKRVVDQTYEGLTFRDTEKVQKLENSISYLMKNNYDIGYATFWESNILAELSDGQVRTVTVTCNQNTGSLSCYRWLTLNSLISTPKEKPFVLLDISYQNAFASSEISQYCTLAFEDDYHCIYDIRDYNAFVQSVEN